MNFKLYKLNVFVILLCIFSRVFSVNIGSDTIVNLFTTQQIVNNNDRIASFAFLKGGFKLDDQNVTGDFDSVFPVYGDVGLVGGTLDLSLDLVFSEGSIFSSLGNINGNGQAIKLAPSMKSVPVNTTYVSFDSFSTGGIYCNEWSYNDKFVAMGYNSGLFSVYEVVDNVFVFRDSVDLGTYVFQVHWHPTANYVAVARDYNVSGAELYIYEVDQNGNLTSKSEINFDYSVMSVRWHPSGDYIAVPLSDDSIIIYNVSDGIIGSVACSETLGNSPNPEGIRWHKDGEYLAISADDLDILKFDYSVPSSCTLTIDAYDATTGKGASVSWSDVEDYILVYGNNTYLKFFKFDLITPALTLEGQYSMNVVSVEWKPGENVFVVAISSDDTRIYQFDPSDYSITLLQEDINYLFDPTWAHSHDLFAGYSSGSEVLYGVSVVEFNNLNMFLNGNITFNSEITFVGDSLIDGRGNSLDMSENAEIIVGSSSGLKLKNITIKGLSGTNINCTDSTSTFTLENCTWILSDDYTFDQGNFEIFGDFEIIGKGYNFNYTTDQESIINLESKLILKDVNFNYLPINSSKDLLSFINNEDSVLVLNNATFDTGSVGINLIKGKLQLMQDSDLSTSDEITFGDSSLSANDLICDIPNGVKLQVLDGTLNYKNVSSISWPTTNLAASLYMYQDSILNLYQNLNVGAGSVIVGDNVTIGRASGKSIVGSLIPLGSVVYTDI